MWEEQLRASTNLTVHTQIAMSLKKIAASQILDSRGNPTVRVVVTLSTNVSFEAQVPSGASKGSYEALELRDEIPSVFGGKGVLQAVRNVNDILGPALLASGLRPDQQSEVDKLMCATDGSKDKSNLGANAILGVSMAVARAGAFVRVRRLTDIDATLAVLRWLSSLWTVSLSLIVGKDAS